AFILAFVVLKCLPDGPAEAPFLTAEEKTRIAVRLAAEDAAKDRDLRAALRDARVFVLGLSAFGMLCGGYGLQLWLPLIVQEAGFSTRATGFVVALPATLATGAMILWGRSSDLRGQPVRHCVISILLSAAALAVGSIARSNLIV